MKFDFKNILPEKFENEQSVFKKESDRMSRYRNIVDGMLISKNKAESLIKTHEFIGEGSAELKN